MVIQRLCLPSGASPKVFSIHFRALLPITIFFVDNSSAADSALVLRMSSQASEINRPASVREKVRPGGVLRSAAGLLSQVSAANKADGAGESSLHTKSSVSEFAHEEQDTTFSLVSLPRTKRSVTLVASSGSRKSGMSLKSAVPARV